MNQRERPLGFGRPFNRADLARMRDDGRRPELVDGVLIVTFVPGLIHQRALARLARALADACPQAFEVLPGPFAVGLSDDTEMRPDVVVARREKFTEVDLPGAPELAVEITSPATRTIDLHVKRERFERAGTPSYWVLDPVARPAEARLMVWELHADGRYRQVADVTGEEEFHATLPYPMSVNPGDLVR